MPRRNWFDCSADEINERYIEYLGVNKQFDDQNELVTVERFADIVRPIYDAKIVDLEDEGIENARLKVSNHFNEILDSAFEGVTDAIREHLPEVDPDTRGLSKYQQGVSKTGGSLFSYLLVYNLATNLLGTDVAVAYHMPAEMEEATTLIRDYGDEELTLPLEGDLVVFKPDDLSAPTIMFSMKSSMKERSHIVTMWALLRDIGQDEDLREQYNIEVDDPHGILDNVIYTFATADLAGDFDDEPRNLIKMDMSFVDYAFLARANVAGARSTVNVDDKHLIHHMDAVYDLISKVYDIDYDQFGAVDFELTDDGIKKDRELAEFTDN